MSHLSSPLRYDFFLVSQSVRQGTVNPTSYNVVEDTSGLKPEHLQKLTYKLTHLYYNWPGTVRVPAPCQYAHKVRSPSCWSQSSSYSSSYCSSPSSLVSLSTRSPAATWKISYTISESFFCNEHLSLSSNQHLSPSLPLVFSLQ